MLKTPLVWIQSAVANPEFVPLSLSLSRPVNQSKRGKLPSRFPGSNKGIWVGASFPISRCHQFWAEVTSKPISVCTPITAARPVAAFCAQRWSRLQTDVLTVILPSVYLLEEQLNLFFTHAKAAFAKLCFIFWVKTHLQWSATPLILL